MRTIGNNNAVFFTPEMKEEILNRGYGCVKGGLVGSRKNPRQAEGERKPVLGIVVMDGEQTLSSGLHSY